MKTPACFAAVRGSAARGTAALPTAAGARRGTAATAWGSVSRFAWTELHCSLFLFYPFSSRRLAAQRRILDILTIYNKLLSPSKELLSGFTEASPRNVPVAAFARTGEGRPTRVLANAATEQPACFIVQ